MLTISNIASIVSENLRRRNQLHAPYDPISGEGSPTPRFAIPNPVGEGLWYLPEPMKNTPFVRALLDNKGLIPLMLAATNNPVNISTIQLTINQLIELRYTYDFEFWAANNNTIKNKKGEEIKLILNQAQRKIHLAIETQRLAGNPIRINLLKCRQYGGTTYVRGIFNWFQTVLFRNWNCAIAADVQDQAKHALGMFDVFATKYPNRQITTRAYQASNTIKQIVQTGGLIAVGSVEKPEALSGKTFQLLHATEVGKWKETKEKSAESLFQSLYSAVPMQPNTIVVRESTAKGLNYWYREWQKSRDGQSKFINVFVGTYEIEEYQLPIVTHPKATGKQTTTAYRNFIETEINTLTPALQEYANFMWDIGATLESIKWYFNYMKTVGYDHFRMQEEYPNTPDEAFQSSGRRAFPQQYVQNIRPGCTPPLHKGELYATATKGKEAFENLNFKENEKGELQIWTLPDKEENISNRYLVVIDIGGLWFKDEKHCADWSVIRVLDRYWLQYGGVEEYIATWRGHIDRDLLAWKGAQIAKFYNNALLVVERNSLKSKGMDGNLHRTILNEIVDYYPNIYASAQNIELIRQGLPAVYGFSTGSNKPLLVDHLRARMRDNTYRECDGRVPDECDRYEEKPDGTYGAMEGEKDDMVMASAIGLFVSESMPPPVIILPVTANTSRLTQAAGSAAKI